ncbi:MAG: TMEM175 family protein [Candidatus Eremiobacteraeota bacterium]|nr:TMEM175 family protein [Candidatus Eremiobacteraeota bacterium]
MDSPEDRQRFTRRLEAFSDIVFGFALAQSAVALEVPKNAGDVIAHAGQLIYFVVTFVVIVMFWVMHYRIFHYVFAARRLDVLLNFLLLAVVALLPYALRIYIQFPDTALGSGTYALALGIGLALIAALEYRGLDGLSGEMRQRWTGIAMRHGIPAAVFLLSVPLFVVMGAYARLEWVLVVPALLLARRFARAAAAAAGTAPARSES